MSDTSPNDVVSRRLIKRAYAGCSKLADQLVKQYSGLLRRIIRRRLNRQVLPIYDEDDALQSVWGEFFGKEDVAEIVSNPNQLQACLRGMARNKADKVNRTHLQTQKRGRAQETARSADLPDSRPTPEQVVAAQDEVQALLREMQPRYQQAIRMLLDGHNQRETADATGISERSMGRLLEELRRRRLAA